MGQKLQRIPINKIDYYQPYGGWLAGHGPDKRKRNAGLLRSEGPPIDVERRGGRYRMIDGNDRKYYGHQAGRTHIWARVW